MELKYKTKEEGVSPNGKPRVFFAATEKDFKLFFEGITKSIWKFVDCAVYHFDYETDYENDEEIFDLLNSIQMVVVPVTSELLYVPELTNMKNIPIIPIIMEGNAEISDAEFEKLFGAKQYLDRTEGRDQSAKTQEPYEVKLEKTLKNTLIGNELAEKVRAAFDAHIFLSYRKKDRVDAQKLMRLIHSDPRCENIAIWYDEFLVPGESYNDAIAAAIEACDEFVFNVTDSFTQEGNYVVEVEYPRALESKKPIIPVEMSHTDKDKLSEMYERINEWLITFENRENVCSVTLESVKGIIDETGASNPMHTFLLGLAYLNGIDVEVDKEKGEKLLEKAANEGVPEAMEKLAQIYFNVKYDVNEASKWQKKAVVSYKETLKEDEKNEELFERFSLSVEQLAAMYKHNEDKEGYGFCAAAVEEVAGLYTGKVLEQPEEYRGIFGKVERLRGLAAKWLVDEVNRARIIESIKADYDKLIETTGKAEDNADYVNLLCKLAENNLLKPYDVYKKYGELRNSYYAGKTQADYEREDMEYLRCKISVRVFKLLLKGISVSPAGYEENMVNRNYILNDVYTWWENAEYVYKTADKNVKKHPESQEWKKVCRDISDVMVTGLTKVIGVNIDYVIAPELMDDWERYSKRLNELMDEIFKSEDSLEERYRIIDFMTVGAFEEHKVNSGKLTEFPSGITPDEIMFEKYRKGLDMAKRVDEEVSTIDSRIYYWKKLYFCSGMDKEYAAKEAVNVARDMYAKEKTIQTARMLAYSLDSLSDTLTELNTAAKREALALYDFILGKISDDKMRYKYERKLLDCSGKLCLLYMRKSPEDDKNVDEAIECVESYTSLWLQFYEKHGKCPRYEKPFGGVFDCKRCNEVVRACYDRVLKAQS
jgi:hypothetical protein